MKPRRPAGAIDAALRYLARRALTRRELADRLTAGGYSPDEVGEAVERLAGWGYLDDRAVARRALEECLNRRPRGREFLAHELLARGVPAEIVRETLAAYTQADEEEAARKAIAGRGLSPGDGPRDLARAWRMLARLGFAEAVAERVCGAATLDTPRQKR
ncbi:MAG: regulatory protein RecX [Bacteroidota bacterium]